MKKGENMIIIESLSCGDILHNIDLKIPFGVNYIKGGNGSGKSTLLDCICNMNREFDGTIEGNQSIVYLNQHLYFSYRLTSKDFISFVLSLGGINDYKKVFLNYVSNYNMVEKFENIWNKQVGMLSGGERTILFFTAISCIEKDWYVFDEPFSGIDEEGKKYMVKIIDRLYKEKKGIIITSHEEEPLEYFDNINLIKINKGEIVGN